MWIRARLLALLPLLFCSSVAAWGLPSSYGPLAGNVAHEDALLQHANRARLGAGLAQLALDDSLTLAARHHAAEMAALSYLSHESPRPENARLPQRLARAGSPVRTAAENLARVPDGAGAARAAVEGWMASPGHRVNLLDARFTHVGFGTAATDGGALYVVQVLAHQPLRLSEAAVATVTREVRHLEVAFDLLVPRDLLWGAGESYHPAEGLAPGRHVVRLPHEGAAPVHVRAGTRVAADEGPFVGQDGGWFDPASGAWRPSDTFPREELRIEAVALRSTRRVIERVALTFAATVPAGVAVWVDGAAVPASVSGDRIELEAPQLPGVVGIEVGVPLDDGSGRYRVSLGLALRGEGAERAVYAAGAE